MQNRQKRSAPKAAFSLMLCVLLCLVLGGCARAAEIASDGLAGIFPEKEYFGRKTAFPDIAPRINFDLSAVSYYGDSNHWAEQTVDFDGLHAINPDAYAYIVMPDSVISYPVMQSSTQEEDYYLDVTFEGRHGYPGSIYTRMTSAKDFSDAITTIYGHEMANGTYFGGLKQFANPDYFNTHRTIYIYLPEVRKDYMVIANVIYPATVLEEDFDCQGGSNMDKLKEALLGSNEAGNLYSDDFSFGSDDHLIVLYTCVGSREEVRRFIVAKQVDEKMLYRRKAE